MGFFDLFSKLFSKPYTTFDLSSLEPDGKFRCDCKIASDFSLTMCSFHRKSIKFGEDCIIYYYFDKNKRVPVTLNANKFSEKKWDV